jgi:predicted tellurium resistance membrane protein TerC
MDISTIKIIVITITLILSAFWIHKYRNIPTLNLTLLCFIAFQMVIKDWMDFLFLIGIGCILFGINIEFVRMYKKVQELEDKDHGSDI